jgi:hypothetical protein
MKVSCSCVLLLALAASLAAEDNRSAETKIIALEKAWNQAFRSHDGRALGTIFSDSIVIVNVDGKMHSKGEFLAEVNRASLSETQQTWPESITVIVYGDVAVATGILQEKGIEKGKSYLRRYRFADTWIQQNTVWKCVAASATPILR